MKDVLTSIFSTDGALSSSRIGYYISLLVGCGLAIYDTVSNSHLEVATLVALLTAGAGGYVAGKAIDSKAE